MPREANKLSAAKVSKLKTPGRYCVGLGLWLQVSQAGTKAWLFRYMRHGRARQMSLGALHTVSLAEARIRARQARQIILDGDDPIEMKRKKRDEARSDFSGQIFSRMPRSGSSICTRMAGGTRSIVNNGKIRFATTPSLPSVAVRFP